MFRRAILLGVMACGCSSSVPDLVPPTADEDPDLPQVSVKLAGHTRVLHLETFGDPNAPVLFVFHGGGGSDYRAMLPLRALSDRYYVVMWDSRGSGLSERVGLDEISVESYAEEVHALKRRFSPTRPVSMVGYSYAGFHIGMWLARFPEDLDQLILVEPAPFDSDSLKAIASADQDLSLTAAWVNRYLAQNEFLTPDDHATLDYKLQSVALPATRAGKCDPNSNDAYPMWRVGGLITARVSEQFDDVDERETLSDVKEPVLLIASQCGKLNMDYQREHIAPLFESPKLVTLPRGVDHLNLFQLAEREVLAAARDFLGAYQDMLP